MHHTLAKIILKIAAVLKGIFFFSLFSTGLLAGVFIFKLVPGLPEFPIWQMTLCCALAWFIPLYLYFRSLPVALIGGVTNAAIPLVSWIYCSVLFDFRTNFFKLELAVIGAAAYMLGMAMLTYYAAHFHKDGTADEE